MPELQPTFSGGGWCFRLRKGDAISKVLFIIALPIHAIAEGLVVVPFGIPWEGALINTVGGALHHIADFIISFAILKVVQPYLKNLVAKKKPEISSSQEQRNIICNGLRIKHQNTCANH